MDDDAVAAEAAQVKGAVMKPWMIAVLASVVVILAIAGAIWLRSRKRKDEEPQAVEGGAAGALAPADSGDEAGAAAEPGAAAESGAPASSEPASGEAASSEAAAPATPGAPANGGAGDAGAAPAGAAPATPDLLTDAEQISDEEIDAGRTAALKKMLDERGRQ